MKTLITMLLAFLCLSATAQIKFNGIGIFKIGVDTSVVYSFAKSLDVVVKPLQTKSEYYSLVNTNTENQRIYNEHESELHVFKISKTINDGEIYHVASDCPDVSEYFLNEYEISGINLYNVTLKFYKGKLFDFSCNYSNSLIDAMTTKYGKPLITKKMGNRGSCVVNQKTSDTWCKWKSGAIVASSFYSKDFGEDCKERILSGFNYGLDDKTIDNCEHPSQKQSLSKF